MTDDIYLQAWRRCSHCHGAGWAHHPDWLRYRLESAVWSDRHPRHPGETPEQYRDRRRIDFDELFWADAGHGPWQVPPEIAPCDECDARGVVHLELELSTLLRMVDAALRVA